MAIAERMPEVGRRYYEHVLEKTIDRLAAYLRSAHVEAGDVAIDDCTLAASQFMQMCQATLFQPFIFQAAPAPSGRKNHASDRKPRDADVYERRIARKPARSGFFWTRFLHANRHPLHWKTLWAFNRPRRLLSFALCRCFGNGLPSDPVTNGSRADSIGVASRGAPAATSSPETAAGWQMIGRWTRRIRST